MANRFRYVSNIEEDHGEPIWAVRFHPFLTNVFATASGRGEKRPANCRIYILEGSNIELIQAYVDENGNEAYYTCEWVFPESEIPMLAFAGKSGLIKVANVENHTCAMTLRGHGGPVNELAAHPTEKHLLLSGSDDMSVRLWNINSQQCLAMFAGFEGHKCKIISVGWKSDGTQFASGGLDYSVRIWDIPASVHATKKTLHVQAPLLTETRVHRGYVDCVRWIGNLMASKSTDNRILIWRPQPGDYASEYAPELRIDGTVAEDTMTGVTSTSLSVTPATEDDQTENEDLTARDLPLAVLSELRFENCHEWFMRFSVHAKKRICVIGSNQGSAFLFDLNKCNPIDGIKPYQEVQHKEARNSKALMCSFNHDATILLLGCSNGIVWRYDCDTPSSTSV